MIAQDYIKPMNATDHKREIIFIKRKKRFIMNNI